MDKYDQMEGESDQEYMDRLARMSAEAEQDEPAATKPKPATKQQPQPQQIEGVRPVKRDVPVQPVGAQAKAVIEAEAKKVEPVTEDRGVQLREELVRQAAAMPMSMQGERLPTAYTDFENMVMQYASGVPAVAPKRAVPDVDSNIPVYGPPAKQVPVYGPPAPKNEESAPWYQPLVAAGLPQRGETEVQSIARKERIDTYNRGISEIGERVALAAELYGVDRASAEELGRQSTLLRGDALNEVVAEYTGGRDIPELRDVVTRASDDALAYRKNIDTEDINIPREGMTSYALRLLSSPTSFAAGVIEGSVTDKDLVPAIAENVRGGEGFVGLGVQSGGQVGEALGFPTTGKAAGAMLGIAAEMGTPLDLGLYTGAKKLYGLATGVEDAGRLVRTGVIFNGAESFLPRSQMQRVLSEVADTQAYALASYADTPEDIAKANKMLEKEVVDRVAALGQQGSLRLETDMTGDELRSALKPEEVLDNPYPFTSKPAKIGETAVQDLRNSVSSIPASLRLSAKTFANANKVDTDKAMLLVMLEKLPNKYGLDPADARTETYGEALVSSIYDLFGKKVEFSKATDTSPSFSFVKDDKIATEFEAMSKRVDTILSSGNSADERADRIVEAVQEVMKSLGKSVASASSDGKATAAGVARTLGSAYTARETSRMTLRALQSIADAAYAPVSARVNMLLNIVSNMGKVDAGGINSLDRELFEVLPDLFTEMVSKSATNPLDIGNPALLKIVKENPKLVDVMTAVMRYGGDSKQARMVVEQSLLAEKQLGYVRSLHRGMLGAEAGLGSEEYMRALKELDPAFHDLIADVSRLDDGRTRLAKALNDRSLVIQRFDKARASLEGSDKWRDVAALKYLDGLESTLGYGTPYVGDGIAGEGLGVEKKGVLGLAASNIVGVMRSGMLSGFIVPNPKFFINNFLTAPAIVWTTLGGPQAAASIFQFGVIAVGRALVNGADPLRKVVVVRTARKVYTADEVAKLIAGTGISKSQTQAELGKQGIDEIVSDFEWYAKSRGMLDLFKKLKNGIAGAGNIYAEVANLSDTYFRTNVLLNALKEGRTEREAVTLARESLFDYGAQMSSIERDWISKIVWFWTFRRNNYAAVAKAVLRDPARARGLSALTNWTSAAGGDEPVDKIATAPFNANRPMAYLAGDEGIQRRYALYGPPIPMVDAIQDFFDATSLLLIGGEDWNRMRAQERAGRPGSGDVRGGYMAMDRLVAGTLSNMNPINSAAIAQIFGVDITRGQDAPLPGTVDSRLIYYWQVTGNFDVARAMFDLRPVREDDASQSAATLYEQTKPGMTGQWRVGDGYIRSYRLFTDALMVIGVQRGLREYAPAISAVGEAAGGRVTSDAPQMGQGMTVEQRLGVMFGLLTASPEASPEGMAESMDRARGMEMKTE